MTEPPNSAQEGTLRRVTDGFRCLTGGFRSLTGGLLRLPGGLLRLVRGLRRLPARMLGAAILKSNVIREVGDAKNATGQAAVVVVLVSGMATVRDYGLGWFPMLMTGTVHVLLWPVWAGIASLVGGGKREDRIRLLRVLGFARTPAILVALLPLIGGIQFAAHTWVLVAGVYGIRCTLEIGIIRATVAAVLGMVPYWVVTAVYLL